MATESFIDAFLDYASNLTDAPRVYHDFASLNLLSLAVGRVPIMISPKPLFPNLWTMLIGASGVTHKSTVIELAMSVLPEDYNFLPNDFTPESLQEALSEPNLAQGLIVNDEIGGFFESIKAQKYMAGMADLLNKLYDCPDRRVRKLRTFEFRVKFACFNILCATTPTRFLDTVKPSDFSTGFMSRFMVVPAMKERSLPRRGLEKADFERRDRCQKLWRHVHDVFHKNTCTFEFSRDALELLNKWAIEKMNEISSVKNIRQQDIQGAINTRYTDVAFKLSALYEVDAKVNEISKLVTSAIVISKESAQKSIETVDILLTLLITNLLNPLSPEQISKEITKISKIMEREADSEGWVQHSKLLPLTNMTAENFKRIMKAAEQDLALIESRTIDNALYYRIKPQTEGLAEWREVGIRTSSAG